MSETRITVVRNAPDYPWPYTAHREVRDQGEWVSVEHEDGDTPEEATEHLR